MFYSRRIFFDVITLSDICDGVGKRVLEPYRNFDLVDFHKIISGQIKLGKTGKSKLSNISDMELILKTGNQNVIKWEQF